MTEMAGYVRVSESDSPVSNMKTGGGSGGGGPIVDTHTKDYVDANIRAARAENSASFAKLEAKIDALPRAPSLWQIASVVAAGITTLLAIGAFAADRFDGGIAAGALVEQAVDRIHQVQAVRDDKQDERLDQILKALDSIKATHKTQ